MKKSSLGKIPLIIGMAALLTSCDQKPKSSIKKNEAVVSTAELAREARFSPWTSRASLQLKMERLPAKRYFSAVEGRLKDGANQYRAIAETFDSNTYREWAVFWGLNEEELFEHEIALLRAGFDRHNTQVFTDSSGVALHQLTMLRLTGVTGAPIPPLADANGAGNVISPAEVKPEDVPDFIKPELRKIDDPIVTEAIPIPDPVKEEDTAISSTEVTETSASPEVMEKTPDSPKPVDPPVAVIVEEIKVEEIKVEEPKPKTVKHRVVRGDTLSKIARRYKVTVSRLKKANGLRGDVIRLKQVLTIPKR